MKYVFIITGSVLFLLAAVWVVGMFLPESHSSSLSRTYPASSSEIYRLLTEVEKFPQWRTNVREVEILNDESKSLLWREYYTNNDPLTFQVLQVEDSTLIVTEIADKNLPFGGTWTYQIEALNDSTKLSITEDGEVYNPFFRFISKFIMGHETTINQYLNDVENKLTNE